MSPLQSELHRLYHVPSTDTPAAGRGLRAMVLEVVAPPSWRALGEVWQGVQDVLGLPAPGIAVSGTDGLQLWFSLAEPVAETQAEAFLEAIRARFLPGIARNRIRLLAGVAAPVPAVQAGTGNWSAFVAPDLAPVFDDTPWLDIEPNQEGQTALLRALRVTPAADFASALHALAPQSARPIDASPATTGAAPAVSAESEPRSFLLRVMNDETAPLALRIEAAKALLPGT